MSGRQSSLLSFFKGGPATPKSAVNSPARKTVKLEKTEDEANEEQKPLKRTNTDENDSPVKGSVKRRRVVMSSDEEEENVATCSTPKTVRQDRTTVSTPRSRVKPSTSTPHRQKNEGISTEMANSFIGSFSFREDDLNDSVLSTATLDQTIYMVDDKKRKKVEDDTQDRYDHEALEWLKPENLKDARGRNMADTDYDCSTLYVPAAFLNAQTPGHHQWWTIKAQNFDTVLFFKVGKFYELYHMDAVVGVKCLSLTFMRGSYAHVGFPEVSYGKFADQLVARGYKVARVEQTETPQQLEERNQKKTGPKEKVVKRELCRVTTSATRTYGVLDNAGGDSVGSLESSSKYLLAIKEKTLSSSIAYGICFIDTSIGKFFVGQFDDDDYRSHLRTLLASFPPSQVLLERNTTSNGTLNVVKGMVTSAQREMLSSKSQFWTAEDTVISLLDSNYLGPEHAQWPSELLEMLDDDSVVPKPMPDFSLCWSALGAVIYYLKRCLIDVDMITMKQFEIYSSTRLEAVKDTSSPEKNWAGKNMILDGVTIDNLNLLPSGDDQQANSLSLYSVLNKCGSSFGKRLLKQWICVPTCDPITLERRQNAVEWLSSNDAFSFVERSSTLLKSLPDLERLLQKIHTLGSKYRAESHPDSRAVMFDASKYNVRKIKDLIVTLDGFSSCQSIIDAYKDSFGSNILLDDLLADSTDLRLNQNHFENSFDRKLAAEKGAIVPEPGCNADYDAAVQNLKNAELALENYRKEQEKELKCKVTYFGTGKNRYQMEIPAETKVNSKYELKSRRKGFDRYHTPQLVTLIAELSEAEADREQQAADATRRIFFDFDCRKDVWSSVVNRIAILDVLQSFARYVKCSGLALCKPKFVYNAPKPFLTISDGSHPCLAMNLNSSECSTGSSSFISNDSRLGGESPSTVLLTGPNMGGKSTLMRQVAALTVMAHMGCFVPATSMSLTPVDRVFTRIGANDRILCGQSTFFVELNETQIIMRDATVNSLVLVDELGRGTSTFDGTAIASAVLSYLSQEIGCRSYFSTHYHSLCTSVSQNDRVALGHMACMVENENEEDPTEECVTFLYRLVDGSCPKSYGFYAAKLAGVREEVVREAFHASSRLNTGKRLTDEKKTALVKAAKNGVSVEELEAMVSRL